MYLFRTLQKYQFTTIISVYAVTLMADPTIEEAIYSKLKVPPLGSGQKGRPHHYGQLERQEEVDASRVGTVNLSHFLIQRETIIASLMSCGTTSLFQQEVNNLTESFS